MLVGVVGCTFDREAMYSKELDFYISTSYGPGRYDASYEEKGIDYPYAYVRWTENRNMSEYLKMLNIRRININEMISAVFDVEEATQAFEYVKNPEKKPLITLLQYDRDVEIIYEEENLLVKPAVQIKKDKLNVAIVGAGAFAKATHLPNLKKLNEMYNIYAIMSRTGNNAKNIAEQYGASYFTTDYEKILNDENVDLVIICTRHNVHAELAIKALQHNKSVLLEKPLALNEDDMKMVIAAAEASTGTFMVGYNRRFSPCMQSIKKEISTRISPLIINYQMNAGYIPLDVWVHTEEGGGRIIVEMCHIVDLCSFLTGSEVKTISVNSIENVNGISSRDNITTTITYKDGSLANIIYTSIGNPQSGKEICDIYCDKKTIKMYDYKKLEGYGTKFKEFDGSKQDKGHYDELKVMYEAIRNGVKYPISKESMQETSVVTFVAENEARQ